MKTSWHTLLKQIAPWVWPLGVVIIAFGVYLAGRTDDFILSQNAGWDEIAPFAVVFVGVLVAALRPIADILEDIEKLKRR